MRHARWIAPLALALVAAFGASSHASATTLQRFGLDTLAKKSERIAVGRVERVHSYWNEEKTFILTDIELRATRGLKGRKDADVVRFTIPGGIVDGIGVMSAEGPDLEPGVEYAVFLGQGPVDGGREALTPVGFTQGVWERVKGNRGERFVSQARGMQLIGDESGRSDVAGGDDGLTLEELESAIADAERGAR